MWQRFKQKVSNSVRGTPIPPSDTEGIATFALFDEDENREDVVGCIVRNNDNFIQLINPKHLYVQKCKKTKHFAYYFQSKDFLPHRAVITVENEVSTSSTSEEITVCKIDNLSAEEKIAVKGNSHYFIPCESENFNKSRFLQYYSKIVPDIVQELGSSKIAEENNKFYGLGKDEQRRLTLVFMEVKRCEQAQNLLFVDDNVYDKLIDGPLFLDDKTTLVGWCTKNEENKKIDIHNFKKQDRLDVWKASVTDSLTAQMFSVIKKKNNTNANIENGDGQARGGDNQDRSSDTKESQGECEAPALDLSTLTDSSEGSTNSNSSKISNQDKSNPFRLLHNETEPTPSDERRENGSDFDDCTVGNKDRLGGDGESSDSEGNSCDAKGTLLLVSMPQSQESAGQSSIDSHKNPLSQSQELEPSSNAIQQNSSRRNIPIERCASVISNGNQSNSNVHLPTQEGGLPGAVMISESLRQVTLYALCRKDSTVIEDVSFLFDDKTKKFSRKVIVLADRVGAHPVIKNKCESNYGHSPSSELIKMPHVSMLSVQDFADNLQSMGKEGLAQMIKAKVQENHMLKQVAVVLLEPNMHELLEEVTAELDKPDYFNWRYLGKQLLGIEDHVLDCIEARSNPAERFLVDYAYSSVLPEELKLSRFYQHMAALGREDEVSILFGKYEISKDDPRHMKKVFNANSKAMEDLCLLLNVKDHCKGWQHLAERWGVREEIYFQYIPDTTVSPTRILLEWLMMARPEFTVFDLIGHLRELERYDICEVLREKLLAANAVHDLA